MPASQDDWDTCPKGQIETMVSSLRRVRHRERVHQIGKVTLASGAAVVLIAVVAVTFSSPGDSGELTCREVVQSLESYRREVLDSEMMQRIAAHLERCPHCQEQYDRLQTNENGDAARPPAQGSGTATLMPRPASARFAFAMTSAVSPASKRPAKSY